MGKLVKRKKDEAQLAKKQEEMPFLDHLEELRITLVKSAIVVVIFAVILCFFAFKLNALLMWPFDTAVANLGQEVDRPRTASPIAPFMIYFEIVVFGSLFLSLPFILFFLAQFIAPALTKREKGVLIPGLSAAAVLFVLGASMAFFILLPLMLNTSFRLSEALEISVLYDAASYYSVVMLVTIGVGVSFELPLLVVILIYVGLLKPAWLRKYRRHIFVLLVIFSAFITPPDPLSLAVIAVPLYILYELAVYIGERLLKKKLAKEAQEEKENWKDPYDETRNDSRYSDFEYKRDENNPEDSYYLSYEEERKHYPEGTDPHTTETLTEAAENEAGLNEELADDSEDQQTEDSDEKK